VTWQDDLVAAYRRGVTARNVPILEVQVCDFPNLAAAFSTLAELNSGKDSEELSGLHNLDVLEYDNDTSTVRCLLSPDLSEEATLLLTDINREPLHAAMSQDVPVSAARLVEPIGVPPPPRLAGSAWAAAIHAAAARAQAAFAPRGLALAKAVESAAGFHFSLELQQE
jgi:hypothetical protein